MSPSTTTCAADGAEGETGEVDRADAVDVAHVAEPLERARLAARGVRAGAQHDRRPLPPGARGEHDLDVLQVVSRSPRRAPCAGEGTAVAAATGRRRGRSRRGARSLARLPDVLALRLIVDGDDGQARLAQLRCRAGARPGRGRRRSRGRICGTARRSDEPGEVAADQALHEAAGEGRGEEQRDEHALRRDHELEPLRPRPGPPGSGRP